MGFTDLALVTPRDAKVLTRHKVVQRASGAKDVLQNAKVCSSLEEAVRDRNVVCGTGMPFDMYRKRRERAYAEPRVFFEGLVKEKRGEDDQLRLALVFGSEQTGMLSEPRAVFICPMSNIIHYNSTQEWKNVIWIGAMPCWGSQPTTRLAH